MSFFDTTPTGRILSRFSNDLHTVDHEIADYVDIFVFIVLQLAVVMLTIVVITPFCKSETSVSCFRCITYEFSHIPCVAFMNLKSPPPFLEVAVALPFLGTIYIFAMNYFRRVSRETKRLESIAK